MTAVKWTIRLGRLAGIDVKMHATFLLFVAWVALAHWLDAHSLRTALEGVLFILALFGCVLAHEFSHALMARRFGIATHDITLLPIGGVSRLATIPTQPVQEFWVAMAGPAASVGIAVLLFVAATLTEGIRPLSDVGVTEGPFLERLMFVNVLLAAFNLLPAFPMDGGRVLRSLLAMRLDHTQATFIAARLGQGLAFLLGVLGLFGNPMLVLIALFVWIGAAQEGGMARLSAAVRGVPVSALMRSDFTALSPDDPLEVARDLSVRNAQHEFPVVAHGTVVGILARADLFRALSARPHAPVAEVMHREFETADSAEMLDGALDRLQGSRALALPVTHDGRLVGLISMDNLLEFMRLQARRPLATGSARA